MAQCKNCKAELPEGVDFCEQCGTPVADKSPKKKSSSLFGGKDKKSKSNSALSFDANIDTELPEPPTEPLDIEAEAKAWAKETGGVPIESEPVNLPTHDSVYVPDKRVVPSAVFIARTKNGIADKFFGLLLFFVVLAVIIMSFVLNTGLLNPDVLLDSVKAYIPLLMLSLGAIVIARTGSVDVGIPIVSVITYFLLSGAFSQGNVYPIMVMSICVAVFIGLGVGILTVIGKVPAVFSSFVLLFIGIVYLNIMLGSDTTFMKVAYTDLSVNIVPLSLVIVSVMATFILIYMTNLGKPLFKRKGITTKNKWLYILSFAFAYFLAAGGGIMASFHADLTANFSNALFYTFDLVLGVLFVVALSGATTLFDNRSMPLLVALLSFLVWFAVCFVLANSVGNMQSPLVAGSIKIAFVLLAMIADRVYTKTQLADFYQTIHVKK